MKLMEFESQSAWWEFRLQATTPEGIGMQWSEILIINQRLFTRNRNKKSGPSRELEDQTSGWGTWTHLIL